MHKNTKIYQAFKEIYELTFRSGINSKQKIQNIAKRQMDELTKKEDKK